MAGRELNESILSRLSRQIRSSRLAIVGLLALYVGGLGQPAFAQPECPAPTQWKQSIERPNEDWDYDGKRILGHLGYDIFLWDAETGKLLQRMKGHRERIYKVQFSPNCQSALSSSWSPDGPMTNLTSRDTRTILWDLSTGQSTQCLPGQVAGEFSPDGGRIVTFYRRSGSTTSFDAVVSDVSTGRELVKVTLEDYSVPQFDDLLFSPDGTRFVHLHSRGAVQFDCRDGHLAGRATASVGIHRYTSNGMLACFDLGRDAGRVSKIDIESGRLHRDLEHRTAGVTGSWRGAWTHDGRKIAVYPSNGAIQIWDTQSATSTTGAQGGHYPQHHAIISPDNSRLAIMWGPSVDNKEEDDAGIGLYDLDTGAEIVVIGLARTGRLIGFSPDSKSLLVGGPKLEEDTSENEEWTSLPTFVIYNSENGDQIRTVILEQAPRP